MAGFRLDMPKDIETKLLKMQNTDEIIPKMISAASGVVERFMRGTKFGKYVRVKRPKKNKFGWFSLVDFNGKTSSGAPAALAANVYEYGRGGNKPQPARPHIRKAIQDSTDEAKEAMQSAFEEAVK